MAEFLKRINSTQELLEQKGLNALIVDDPLDLYYLTGLELSKGRLFLSVKQPLLIVDGRYFEHCQKDSPIPVLQSQSYEEGSPFSKMCVEQKGVGFDALVTTFHEYKNLCLQFPNLIPLKHPIKRQRAIKDEFEIEKLKKSAQLNNDGYAHLLSLLENNLSEKEMAIEFELFLKKKGGDKVAFNPIIAFGTHSSQPHHIPTHRKGMNQNLVLFDLGVVLEHYHSDMTRTLFLGSPNKELVEVYQIVEEAQKRALDLCKSGTRIGDLDKAARKVIADHGYGDFFTHSLGHGVGLEIHEYPSIRNSGEDADLLLEEGMVITIEPGIYLPKKGGVRIEDTVVIKKNGYENLTRAEG